MRFTRNRNSSRGMLLVYVVIAMTALSAFVSLGVDFGRVRLAKAQMQAAVDAAARYAVAGAPNGITDVRTRAVLAAAYNSVDGTPVVISPTADVELGVWNSSTKVFTVTSTNPNAVRISGHRRASSGNAIPLLFGKLIGIQTCDVNSSAIAMLQGGSTANNIAGIFNPWLAGMPAGSYGGSAVSGTAPANSPVQMQNVALTAGSNLTFSVTGSAADDPVNVNAAWTPDGQPGGVRTNDSGYLNGMSQLTAQQGSLIGVFLNDNAPTVGSTPAALNFSTSASMDFTTLSPALKQPFFIGDGKRSNGTVQQFVVPAGATRLYLGMHDNVNWANNSGYFLATINSSAPDIVTVK